LVSQRVWSGVGTRILAALIVAISGPAAADAQPIAQVNDEVPIAAHGGWVVWSAKQGRGFRLFAWHGGTARQLAVRGRPRPFDVDVGTDARGRAVATFSRCRRFRAITVWEASRRDVGIACRLRVVDLVSGRERSAGAPEGRGVSDTMPSMWQGRLAFARRDPRVHNDVDQVMLWSPRQRALTRLRHGAMPTACPFRDARECAGARVSGEVTALDLGSRLVAFRWGIQAPSVIGHGGYEVRADDLSRGRSALVGSGYIGEFCTGGIDGTTPAAPTVDANRVWYSRTATNCYRVTATLNAYRPFPVVGRRGDLDAIVLQAVKDGPALYELVAPPNGPNELPTCTPCAIQRAAPPALQPIRLRPHSPFI
jgi:hypothetical protein